MWSVSAGLAAGDTVLQSASAAAIGLGAVWDSMLWLPDGIRIPKKKVVQEDPCEPAKAVLDAAITLHYRRLTSEQELAEKLNLASKKAAFRLAGSDAEASRKILINLFERPVAVRPGQGVQIDCHFPERVSATLNGSVTPQVVWDAWMDAFLKEMDPHSMLLSTKDMSRFLEHLAAQTAGVGVIVQISKEGLVVMDVEEDSPAARAGIGPGDRILGVESRGTALDCSQAGPEEILKVLKGAEGEAVGLTVRKASGEVEKFSLVREMVITRYVRSLDVGDGVVLVRVFSFGEEDAKRPGTGTAAQVRMELAKYPGARGVILDLRANPGGVYQQTAKVVDHFLDRGLVSTAWDREGRMDARSTLYAETEGQVTDAPMAVLVNEQSASASELVAQVLSPSDYGRAVIVGSGATFGKGSVTCGGPLPDGRLIMLTRFMYFTAGGTSPHLKGVKPSVAARDPYIEGIKKEISKPGYRGAPLRETGYASSLPAPAPLSGEQRVFVGDAVQPFPILPMLASVPADRIQAPVGPVRDHGAQVSKNVVLALGDICPHWRQDGCRVNDVLANRGTHDWTRIGGGKK